MWDEKYSAEHYIYGRDPNDFLRKNIGLIPKGDVLCVAEGEGRNAVFLAKQGYSVTAVDSSLVGLKKAEKLAKENNVSINFVHSTLEEYDLGSNKWIGIISIFCHLLKPARRNLHTKILKGLRKNGVFLLEAYTSNQLKYETGGPPTEDLMMSKEILLKELANLTFNHLLEIERSIVEGTHHCGVGSVVQAIGI